VDVLVRPGTAISVRAYDGVTLPEADASYDVVMMIDVLHHTDDPTLLLREAGRVSKQGILIKDHFRDGLFAEQRWLGLSVQ
jgi:ubiquinone/menaquinone biosynthesis C-methylase UbiE